jgi:hypothetical protein
MRLEAGNASRQVPVTRLQCTARAAAPPETPTTETRRPRGIAAALKPDYAPHLRVKGTKSWAADEPQKPGG